MARNTYSDLYNAIQQSFNPEDMTKERLEQWMTRGKGNVSAGTSRIASQLSETSEVYEQIVSTEPIIKNKSSLISLQDEARSLKIYSDKAQKEARDRLSIIEETEAEIKQAKADYKSARTVDELDSAVDRLRDLDPRTLGGLRSGEIRRARAAFETLFEEQA